MTERVPLLLPVNWRNALAYYAQGLVVPGEALTKYHEDLLQLAPRRLPLLTGGVSASVAEMCASTSYDFPVALELDGGVSVRGEELDIGGARAAAAPAGVIPTCHVRLIHVPSEEDREQFQTRMYRNVDVERLPVTVSRSLFASGGPHADLLSQWLQGLPDPKTVGWPSLVERQSAAGALLLLSGSFPHQEDVLRGAGKLLENVLGRADATYLLNDFCGDLAEVGWISPGDDLSVCATAVEILAGMSGPEPPVPSEVLARMRELLADRNLSDARLVAAYLDRILAIVHGDVVFTPFRRSGGLRAAKGLLLFLLRPDPTAVATWLVEDTNAEAEVIALAVVFAGIAHRSTGLPSELRGSDALQHLLFDWIASGIKGGGIALSHHPGSPLRSERHGPTPS